MNPFSVDRESGNMKFTLLTGIDGKTLIMGKLIFMFLNVIEAIIFNIIISLAAGVIFFGIPQGASQEIPELIILNLCAVFPAMAAVVLVALISQARMSCKAVMAVGIVFAFVMGMADTFTSTYQFSPVGAFSLFADDIPVINSTLITCVIVSFVYICLGVVAIRIISSKYEYYE